MTSGGDLLRSVGLAADGLTVVGRPVVSRAPGVYVVELAEPLATAPIDLAVIGKWIERVPTLRLDGERPTSRALRARLQSFWIPSATVLFIGAAEKTLGGRIRALAEHVLGDPRPHPASQWLRALTVSTLRVRWAETDAPEEYEDALLEAFAATVPDEERTALHDPNVVLPFANLRRSTGERKATGITGATLPLERVPPPPPTRVVEMAPGDADGAAVEERGTGIRRRTNASPPPDRPSTRRPSRARERRPTTPRPPARPAPSSGPAADAVRLTEDGLARMRAELAELTSVRRPEVIDRIRRARELGDLKENADYESAREEQSFLEGRIQALEARLRSAVLIEAQPDSAGRVRFGSRVTLESAGEELVFTIVGPAESDPVAGRISDASPVGRAVIGAAVGDEVVVRTPRGDAHYRVLAVD